MRLSPLIAAASTLVLLACDPAPAPAPAPVAKVETQAQPVTEKPAKQEDTTAMMNILLGKSAQAQAQRAPAPKPRRKVTRVATPDETWDEPEAEPSSLSDDQ